MMIAVAEFIDDMISLVMKFVGEKVIGADKWWAVVYQKNKNVFCSAQRRFEGKIHEKELPRLFFGIQFVK